MNRIDAAFAALARRDEVAFIPFVVAGDPTPEASLEVVDALLPYSDLLEVGIPFSDPLADGPTIQAANHRAFEAGMNTARAFSLLARVREQTDKPLVILTYFNILLNCSGDATTGVRDFFDQMTAAGVDGVIVADLPVEEIDHVWDEAVAHDKYLILLVSPATTPARFRAIQERARGYLYLISLLGVTGARQSLETGTLETLASIRREKQIPVAVGFGISRPEHVRQFVTAGADGVIVGSAVIERVARHVGDVPGMRRAVADYARAMKNETRKRL